mmetsp:Transcript_42919/g.104971  ORF Transcript_42919/g.104971 Transcript_42919/m.104971 type:complete len:229 (-) Transcript_42919:1087-1773(-)
MRWVRGLSLRRRQVDQTVRCAGPQRHHGAHRWNPDRQGHCQGHARMQAGLQRSFPPVRDHAPQRLRHADRLRGPGRPPTGRSKRRVGCFRGHSQLGEREREPLPVEHAASPAQDDRVRRARCVLHDQGVRADGGRAHERGGRGRPLLQGLGGERGVAQVHRQRARDPAERNGPQALSRAHELYNKQRHEQTGQEHQCGQQRQRHQEHQRGRQHQRRQRQEAPQQGRDS